MPAKITEPISRDIDVDEPDITTAALQENTIILYEHRNFKENGRVRLIAVTEHQPQHINSLHVINFKDCLSSLRWNLGPGISVVIFEDHNGGGRIYQIWGAGQDADTHNNKFKDCASSWTWFRFAGAATTSL